MTEMTAGMTAGMTQADKSARIAAIKERYASPREMMKRVGYATISRAITEDIPDLLAEVERLNKALAEKDNALTTAINDLKLYCRACKHNGSLNGPCESCWLQTFPGKPEASKRTNWQWRGPKHLADAVTAAGVVNLTEVGK